MEFNQILTTERSMKAQNISKLHNTLLSNSRVKEEITSELENILKWVKIPAIYKNPWHAVDTMPSRAFVTSNVYIRKNNGLK